MTTFYRRHRMRKPTKMPSVIWLGRPLWLRILRAIVRPLVLAHLHRAQHALEQEFATYSHAAENGKFQLGKQYVHNCAVQREALREKIADWNR